MLNIVNQNYIQTIRIQGNQISTHIRHIAIDQKSNDPPQPAVAIVQTDRPTPINLKGLWLQNRSKEYHNPTQDFV